MQRDQVRVIGDHEDAVAEHRHAAIDAARRITGSPCVRGRL